MKDYLSLDERICSNSIGASQIPWQAYIKRELAPGVPSLQSISP
uniref:Uncharacterized protein n=1 Tax=Setaria viridis TaxID=4556 RepID=A0A4U6TU09_SETVI|nr:hypothetical protein SEVIR_7G227950v2 [Setaria viridis]